jgi:uncharacterized ion transporter superfamily protein YfcC
VDPHGLHPVRPVRPQTTTAPIPGTYEEIDAPLSFGFVLAIGMFTTGMFATTGALDRGIARLAYAVRGRGWLLSVP